MKKFNIVKFIVLCFAAGVCVFNAATLQAAEQPWRLRADKEGIQVYTRAVDGSSFLEFKGRVVVEAPVSAAVMIFEDIKRSREWFFDCVESNIVADEGELQKVGYTVTHLPWPVSERDSVVRITKSINTDTGEMDYQVVALPDIVPKRPGKVRVTNLTGSWRFVPLSDGRTEIIFQQHGEPGGVVPTFIVNSFVVDMPYHSLNNLRSLIMAEKKP